MKKKKKISKWNDHSNIETQKILVYETFRGQSIQVEIKEVRNQFQIKFLKGKQKDFEKIVTEFYDGRLWFTTNTHELYGYIWVKNAKKISVNMLRTHEK